MPITSGDDIGVGLLAGPRLFVVKASQTSEGLGTFHSLWKALGQPGAGATPPAFGAGSGYVPDRTTVGALPTFNPTSPALANLALIRSAQCTVPGGFSIYDRLWTCSGFSTIVTTTQSVVTPGNLPAGRDPNAGLDVEPWLEVYTAPGATGATWTLTGTDAAGNVNRTWVYIHPANAESVGQMVQLLPGGASPAATLGIRQVTSLTCSISSGTAGDVGVTLLRNVCDVSVLESGKYYTLDWAQTGLERIYDDACLAFRVLCSAGTTGIFSTRIGISHK